MAVTYNTTMDQGADWYITFIYKQPAEITNVSGSGTSVTFTAVNGFTVGQTVSIDGILPPQYNLQNVQVATATGSQFTVTNPAVGIYVSGGIATSPVNVTGYSAELQLRSLPSDPTPALTLTSAAGQISVTGIAGQFDVHATAAQTRAIDEGTYYYDIEITSQAGIVTRLAQGQVVVTPEVTR
jgi:hypothetical protein